MSGERGMRAVYETTSSANGTMDRYQRTSDAVMGGSPGDYRKYVAILHLTVVIDMAFAQVRWTLEPGNLPGS